MALLAGPQKFRLWPVMALAFGAASVLLQAVLTREAMVVLSSQSLIVGTVLASWQVGIAAGALLLLRLRRGLDVTLLLLLLLLAAPTSLVLLRLSRQILALQAGETVGLFGALVVVGMAVMPVAMLLGALFTAMSDLAAVSHPKNKNAAAQVYFWEAVGAGISGLLCSLFWLGQVSHETLIALTWVIGLGIASGLAWQSRRRLPRLATAAMLLLAAGLGWVDAATALGQWTRWARFAALAPGYVRVREQDSRRHNLVLARTAGAGDGGSRSLFVDGQHLLSLPDAWSQNTRLHLALAAAHPQPRRVALIGAAAIAAVDGIEAQGVQRLDLLDADGQRLELLRDMLRRSRLATSPGGQRLHLVCAAPLRYVQQHRPRYDLVLIDLGAWTGPEARVPGSEFFLLLRNQLAAGGSVALWMGIRPAYLGRARSDPLASVFAALTRSFAAVQVIAGDGVLLLASKEEKNLCGDGACIRRRVQQRELPPGLLSPSEVTVLVDDDASHALRKSLQQSAIEPASDARPLTIYLSLLLYAHRSSPALARVLTTLRNVPPGLPLLLLLGLLLLRWIWLRRRIQLLLRRRLLELMLTTGGVGMAGSVLLLYLFAVKVGALYSLLALLVAAFMVGLALGTRAALRASSSRAAWRGLLIVEAGQLVFLLCLPLLFAMPTIWPSWLLAILICVALASLGALVGAAFALSERLLDGTDRSRAAWLYAADCAGAAPAALLTVGVLLPLWGLWVTLGLLLLIKLGAQAAFFVGSPERRRRLETC